uniref:EF-hand domain-containing protein n=1 Tax=Globodera rostochiensis TaxID=31243 RepID=A0A914I404_GLORO
MPTFFILPLPIFLQILLSSLHLLVELAASDRNVGTLEFEQIGGLLAEKPLNIIKLADTDGDGKISVDTELKQFVESSKFEQMFKFLFDYQPKGELRLGGFKKTLLKHFAGRRYASQLPHLVDETNVNKNGGIDWHEFKLFTYELGRQLVDVNHDGLITLDESEAFYSWETKLT